MLFSVPNRIDFDFPTRLYSTRLVVIYNEEKVEEKIEHNCNIIHDRKKNINLLPPLSLMIAHKFQPSISMSFNSVCVSFGFVSSEAERFLSLFIFPFPRPVNNHFSSFVWQLWRKDFSRVRAHETWKSKTMSCSCNHHSCAARSSVQHASLSSVQFLWLMVIFFAEPWQIVWLQFVNFFVMLRVKRKDCTRRKYGCE